MRIAGKGHTANQYCKPTTAAIIRQTEQQVRSWSIEHCGDEAPSNDDEMDVLLPHMMSAELPTPVHSLISGQSNIQARGKPACAQTCVIQAAKTGTTRRLPGRGAESVESEYMGALLHSPVLRPTLGAAMVPAAFATLHTKASNQLWLAANSSEEAYPTISAV